MNSHKNARLTFVRRRELVLDVRQRGLTQGAAAAAHGDSVPTVRRWVGRYLAEGEAGLADRSSRPQRSPRAIAPATALAIVELRRRRLTQARIAASLGVSKSTVGRVLARAGLSRLSDLEPAEPIVRYEHAHPGDLVHIDTKKLGRIERLGHRISGDRLDTVDGAGWGFLFVAVDDRARLLTVEENLRLPLRLGGRDDAAGRARAHELLERVGLADRARSFPDRLSGGEQQRVAIARALVHDPDLILADEPTGNLDADTAATGVALFDRLVRDFGKTVVMVTHSREMVGVTDRVFSVQHGHLVEQGGGPSP